MSQSPTGKPAGLFLRCGGYRGCAYKAAENGTYAPLRGTACIDYRNLQKIGLPKRKTEQRSFQNMKATGIVRRIDDLGRVVIPKEIRRTMRIREGDPLQITLAWWERFCAAMDDLAKRNGWK